MDDETYIIGMMDEDQNANGFIPNTTVINRYIPKNQYIVQRDLSGKRVGYLLHGVARPCSIMRIAQTLIDFDKRGIGYGHDVVNQLVQRGKAVNCREIQLTCAEDLIDANNFWLACGFQHVNTIPANNTRNRAKLVYTLPLWKRLF